VVVNFESTPLDGYEHSVPPINYRGVDFGGDQPSDMPGTIKQIGTLSGKRVYSVTYPRGLVVIVVERQQDRYLPVLYSGRRSEGLGITVGGGVGLGQFGGPERARLPQVDGDENAPFPQN